VYSSSSLSWWDALNAVATGLSIKLLEGIAFYLNGGFSQAWVGDPVLSARLEKVPYVCVGQVSYEELGVVSALGGTDLNDALHDRSFSRGHSLRMAIHISRDWANASCLL